MGFVVLCNFLVVGNANSSEQVVAQNGSVSFNDVPSDYWAKSEIDYFAAQRIVSGVGENKFEPEGGVTREQFAKMLVLSFNKSLTSPKESTFSDVSEDSWSYPYVEACREFLIGYSNPYGGKPTFQPGEYAKREDIAVALVKMMGLTDKDVKDPYFATKFRDYDKISQNNLKYVSLATEMKLINGYPDGTFAPDQGITRAETVVLLNRAKQAIVNNNAEIKLSAEVINGEDPKEIYINVVSEEGTIITIDGTTIQMINDGNGNGIGTYTYKFIQEGSKTFEVVASKAGKISKRSITANYKVDGPILKITECPTAVTSKEILIRGSLTDNSHSATLTINGESVFIEKDGQWNKAFILKEGQNKFTFEASNSEGKKLIEERIVVFNSDGPQLKITECPTTVTGRNILIKGTLTDSNYSAFLKINGERVELGAYGYWVKAYTLKDGENKFIFEASNFQGKKIIEERTVIFDDGGPQFAITECPTTATDKYITIRGTLRDNNYRVSLKINGESAGIDSSGNWGTNYVLKEGENKLTFVAENSNGKKVTEERTVVFNVGAPQIIFTTSPESSQENYAYFKGSLEGLNDGVKLYMNDKEVSLLDENNIWTNRFSIKVNLVAGDNTFAFMAVNSYGKATTVVKTIKYDGIKTPLLHVDELVTGYISNTTTYTMTISGTVNDNLDQQVNVFVNGKLVSTGIGNWSAPVILNEGDNIISVVAINKYGKSMKIEKSCRYVKEKR